MGIGATQTSTGNRNSTRRRRCGNGRRTRARRGLSLPELLRCRGAMGVPPRAVRQGSLVRPCVEKRSRTFPERIPALPASHRPDAGEADTPAMQPRHRDRAPRALRDGPRSPLGTPSHRPEVRVRRTCERPGPLARDSASRTGPARRRRPSLLRTGGGPRQQSQPGQSINGNGRR